MGTASLLGHVPGLARKLASTLTVIVLAASLAALSACQSEPNQSSAVELGDVPRVTPTSRLPFDSYRLSTTDRDRLFAHYNELVRTCARRYGVSLVLVSDVPGSFDQSSRMWAGRFGTLPVEHARRYGYHAAPGQPYLKPFTVFHREDEQPQVYVLDGKQTPDLTSPPTDTENRPVPPDGCRGEAAKRIGGNPAQVWPGNSEQIRLAAMHDKRTERAMDAWAACMADRGHSYTKIDEPIDQIAGQPLSAAERATAVSDVLCTRKSRWRDISFAIEKAYQRSAIRADPEALREGLRHQKAMLQAATRLERSAG